MSSDAATASTFTPAPLDSSKRTWLIASGCAGCVGVVALATPFVRSFEPSELAKAAGGPVEVDISGLKPGEKMIVAWRGKPVWILNRTPEMMDDLKKVDVNSLADPDSKRTNYSATPEYACNTARARADRANLLVMVGICTHLGCSPNDRFAAGPQPSLPDNWEGGFLCPCHGSKYDLSGRVFKNQPAPDNMQVPPHQYLSATRLLIGDDTKKA
ncbi:MAG: ubiquinol-cytochrome c reductase iron-sulfur subunit [Burkholderiaceae bacterium]|jgi:ubiquinol-cytochrome c reductase iron-sulfur subunit|nr:ubiquinol-cytochrome c reductase iron-sulfur subunit [Burkholderiaceae bacterium]